MRIGAYEIEDELGRGGMGIVHRARSKEGRVVALKLLARSADPLARERFDRERRILASLGEAEGFVTLLDAGEEKGQPYLVMPFLEGGSLRERLRRGPLGIDETIALAEALAAALSKAHDRGIVHRDLKPENVLRDREGRPFVADLGLAKHFANDSLGTSRSLGLSKTGQLLGTAAYMAPEQASDSRTAGAAADVFSVGAILYECLAGGPAFEGTSMVEVMIKVANLPPPPLASVRPETPPWLVAIVERALATDLRARYAHGGALLDAVRARSAGEAPSRGRRAPVVAAGALALLVAGVAVAAGIRERAVPEAASARPAPSSPGTPAAASGDALVAAARARLEGEASVSSADVPVELLLRAPPDSGLLEDAARRAVVYSRADAERLAAVEGGAAAASVLRALAVLGGTSVARRGAERALGDAEGFELAREVAAAAVAADTVARGRVPLDAVPVVLEGARLDALSSRAPDAAESALAPLTAILETGALSPSSSDPYGSASWVARALRHEGARPDRPPRFARASAAWNAAADANDPPDAPARAAPVLEALARGAQDPVQALLGFARAIVQRGLVWERFRTFDEAALAADERAMSAAYELIRGDFDRTTSVRFIFFRAEDTVAWIRVVEERPGARDGLAECVERENANLASSTVVDLRTARDYVRFALVAGVEIDASTVSFLEHFGGSDALTEDRLGFDTGILLAEMWRRQELAHPEGRAIDALLERLGRAPYVHAVRALLLSDRGQPEDARRELALVPEGRGEPPPLPSLSREAVARYLDEHAAR